MTLITSPQSLQNEQALDLLDGIIAQSQADGVYVMLKAKDQALSRFSENQLSQNMQINQLNVAITSYFGQRSASAYTTDLTPESLRATLERSESLARLAPEDPEWVPLVEPQSYADRLPGYSEETADFSPLARGAIVQRVCAQGQKAGVESSGVVSTDVSVVAIANSEGLKAVARTTDADFSVTARQENGSSWRQVSAINIKDIPTEAITEQVISRAIASRHPREISPGIYPVVFEGAAFASLLPWVIWNLNAREADEGRSFMSRFDENGQVIGNLLGETLFSPLVQVERQPSHPLLQGRTFGSDGLSNKDLTIIGNGIPQTLFYSRYWAKKTGQTPQGDLYPIVMRGSEQSTADLIAQTERGILVSRAWYVRYVNPRTLEVTGMTRDGTFWIENGQIAYPIKNLRFNQVLPEMLREVEGLSQVDRFGGMVVPGVKVGAFCFTSITESI
ncbi:TldD/PmbA family protein [Gloeocapsa sp. PCC 73106]|uniref:TldD/PmbA family protein n=1 Tax=Gloeocapsa sp. PCC 73106 TaxID=102232 RepID=UPI0002ACE136|nr:TldD/PmbA family protein [Gloeocapsa sp. PCC 73106]ELR96528.1 putative Zn-dependent protease-like protein [Gloeocapsa sp. PCC 73106]